jgi:hypothetical protein
METKFRIVETEEYTLAVSDGVKAGDKSVLMVEGFTPMILTHFEPVEEGYEGKKIIAYKPKGNAPELDLPLLPEEECCEGDGSNCNGSCCIVEEDIEKLTKKYINDTLKDEESDDYLLGRVKGFKDGHKAATKVYSEDDVCDFVEWMNLHYRALEHTISFKDATGTKQLLQRWIQSKTPKWFVAEMKHTKSEVFRENDNVPYAVLKTTTINNKTYLVGTYSN